MGLFGRKKKTKSSVDRVWASQIQSSTDGPGLRETYPYAPQSGVQPATAATVFMESPLVWGMTSIVAKLISNVPFNVYILERNTSGKRTIKRSGYPHQMLEFVNPDYTKQQLLEFTAIWLQIAGCAYWALEETDLEYVGVSIMSLYPLNPLFTRVVPDKRRGIDGYVFDIGTDRQYYPANRVIQFKNFSPVDYWSGASPLNPLGFDLQVERYGKRQMRNYFYGGTLIDGVLSIDDDIGDEEVVKLKREFREQHSGTRNAHRILVLTKGMKYDIPRPPAPGENVDKIMAQVDESHAAVLGVPLSVLRGEGEGMIEAKALMWEQVIQPLGRRISDIVTKKLCQPISPRLLVDFDYGNVSALRLKDLDRARVEVARANTGILTINEIRADLNRDPLDGAFANTPIPEWNAQVKQDAADKIAEAAQAAREAQAAQQGPGTGSSPSLPLTGSEGGRDQSSTGEAQTVDETGRKVLNLARSLLDLD